jgi:hypothetical protein
MIDGYRHIPYTFFGARPSRSWSSACRWNCATASCNFTRKGGSVFDLRQDAKKLSLGDTRNGVLRVEKGRPRSSWCRFIVTDLFILFLECGGISPE